MISREKLSSSVSTLVLEARAGWTVLQRAARLACGVADYDTYVAHRRLTHPAEPVMSYEDFFRKGQEMRYGPGMARCC